MSISKASKPFRTVKEMYPYIVQALIDVYSKIRSFVVDLFTSACMCSFSKNSFTIFASNNLSNHLSPCKQHSQGLPKPWVPHPGFGVGYGGFYPGARASR